MNEQEIEEIDKRLALMDRLEESYKRQAELLETQIRLVKALSAIEKIARCQEAPDV